MRRFDLLALALAACACAPSDPTEPADAGTDAETGTVADSTAAAHSDTDTASPSAPPCEIPLRTVSYGDTDRYFVDVVIDGATEVWQLDTGSGLTFRSEGVDAPSYTPELGTLDAGCGPFPFAGRALPPGFGGPDGAVIAGLIGMDFLLQQHVVLEVDAERMLHLDGPPDWPDAVRAPFDDVQSHALVPVTLDGEDVRLMYDTGGGHTLWVGQDGRPGDDVQLVQDAEGNVFEIYVGTGEVELGPLTRTVPVARAPTFPYFSETVEALGGDLHGLLGVTTFPGEALYFDGDAEELWIGPLAED